MNETAPLISVVIPTYNRVGTILAAVRSALDQDYAPLEVIVVDDASSDGTPDLLSLFANRIRYVRHQSNRGASAARNTGIQAARGEYVAFLDSDDSWRPDKTSLQLAFMRKHGFVMSCTGFSSVYGQGTRAVRKRRPYGTRVHLEDIVWGIYVAPGTTLIAERRLLAEIGGYDVSLRRLEDWDLLIKAILRGGEMGFLNEDLATLHPSDGCSIDILEHSARQLGDRGRELLADRPSRVYRHLRAGIAFEVAAAHWKWGSRRRAFAWLSKAVGNAPFGNQSVRIVLLPWLRDVLTGARRT